MKKTMLEKLAGVFAASAFLLSLPAVAGQPGKGWDTFQTGAGEPVSVQTTKGDTLLNGAPGKGWDTFQTGAGEPVTVRKATAVGVAAATGAPGKGWDTFHTGGGEPLPTFVSKTD